MILSPVTYIQNSQMPLSSALFPSGMNPEIEGRMPASVREFQVDSFEPGSLRPLLLFDHGLVTPELPSLIQKPLVAGNWEWATVI